MTFIHTHLGHADDVHGRHEASRLRQVVHSLGSLGTRVIRRISHVAHEALPLHARNGRVHAFPRADPRQRLILDQLNAGTQREVYIVGGGPSLKDVDLSPLADKAVIAVNYSIFTVPNAAYFVTLDPRFFTKIKDRQAEFDQHPAIKVLVHNWPTDRVVVRQDGLTVGPTNADFSAFPLIIRSTMADGFGKTFLDFRNGANSGYCALQLALLLGYRQIHLLGFDLTDAGGQQHFHDAYKLDPNCLPSYIQHFRAGLKMLAEQWREVQVISHSPVSVLNDLIPYEPFEIPAESIARTNSRRA
jgi:hypothetical protein